MLNLARILLALVVQSFLTGDCGLFMKVAAGVGICMTVENIVLYIFYDRILSYVEKTRT